MTETKKPTYKVIKDSKKEAHRKHKQGDFEYSVVYPKFKSILKADTIDFEISKYERHDQHQICFKQKIKIPKNRIEYGDDFVAQDGSMVIFRYRYISKNNRVLTSIEIIK